MVVPKHWTSPLSLQINVTLAALIDHGMGIRIDYVLASKQISVFSIFVQANQYSFAVLLEELSRRITHTGDDFPDNLFPGVVHGDHSLQANTRQLLDVELMGCL